MWNGKTFAAFSAMLLGMMLAPAAFSQIEDMNMNTKLSVVDNQLVVRWTAKGYTHYNVRWTKNGGSLIQVERDGDKDYMFLGTYLPGVVYDVLVQGCRRSWWGSSQCTSWEGARCGTPREPCDGPVPRPIAHRASGLCLDVHAPDQRRNGARVQLWSCNGQDQQLWSIKNGNVISLAGKCLDVHLPELRTNGGRVQVWHCNGSIQQRWVRTDRQIRSGGGKCLYGVGAVPLGKKAGPRAPYYNGSAVRVWACDGSPGQQWQ